MRACEGCRRRKIKCDAATTNSWPCAACTRLKLNCVPPTVSYDKDSTPGVHTFELNPAAEYGGVGMTSVGEYPRSQMLQHHQLGPEMAHSLPQQVSSSYMDNMSMYQAAPYMVQPAVQEQLHYAPLPPQNPMPPLQDYSAPVQHQMYATPSTNTPSVSTTDSSWRESHVMSPTATLRSEASPSELIDALGDLKIDPSAIGTWQDDLLVSYQYIVANPPQHRIL